MSGGNLSAIADVLDLSDEDAQTLRELGRLDPVRGGPMRLERNGEEYMIEPGAWEAAGFGDPKTGLPPNCPITPLGADGDSFYFLNCLGHVHVVKASSSGKGPIDALFAGRSRYLEWAWPRWGKAEAGQRAPVNGYHADEVRRALFDACAWQGAFDLEDKVRGRGCWRADDGSLIYHAGDAVWLGGRWRKCGWIGEHIYPGRPKLGRPFRSYLSEGAGSPGDTLLEVIRTFNWDRGELDARLALGFLMTAKVGGALVRRPVGMINGEEGSGKSVFQSLARELMNGALVKASNTTQAGIYQKVKEDSVAVMIDEAEPDPDRTQKLLELARIAYSGDTLSRGGSEGVGRQFTLMSSCLFSSITQPALNNSDASRMAVLMMRPLVRAATESPLKGIDADLIGRQLMKRWMEWWPRWEKLQSVFRAALIEAGHKSRACDTFVPLAAAAHLALFDDMPDKHELDQWKAWLKADELQETANAVVTWRRCFDHLLNAHPEVFRNASGKKRSVGDYLFGFWKNASAVEDCFDNLPLVGLTVKFPAGRPQTFEHALLFVPATSPALNDLFRDTDWAGRPAAPGPWLPVLRQAPKELWFPDKCGRGLDKKASGISIRLAEILDPSKGEELPREAA